MFMLMLLLLLLPGLWTAGMVEAIWSEAAASLAIAEPMVDLGYGVYRGYYNETSRLNIFKGIRYAAAPIGSRRWQKPQAPEVNRTKIFPATQDPPMCPQSNGGPLRLPWIFLPTDGRSEDCLFLNVRSPHHAERNLQKNIRNRSRITRSSSSSSGLPVLVFIHGGGYGTGDGNLDFSELVMTNNDSFILVTIQYRLGAFGFLSSAEVAQSGVANAGLYDMHFALEWVQKHIAKFGGDPRRVTISGESAGAGGVMQLALAYGGSEGSKYFQNAIVASPYLPMQWAFDSRQPTDSYHAFAAHVGCSDERNASVFQCLVNKDTWALQNASDFVSQSAPYGQRAFLPVVDGSFIEQLPSKQLLVGKVNGERMLSGHNAAEAVAFVPQIVTESDFDVYIRSLFPLMSNQTLRVLSEVYAIAEIVPGPRFSTLGYSGPTALNQSEFAIGQQQRALNLYAETTFVCPSYWLSHAYDSHHRKGWKYQYSVPPAGHAADLNAYFQNNLVQYASGTLSQVFRTAVQRSWGQFIKEGDPTLPPSMIDELTMANGNKSSDDISAGMSGHWPTWKKTDMQMLNINMTGGVETTLLWNTSWGEHFNITRYANPGLRAKWDVVDAKSWEGNRGDRCDFWALAGAEVPE